MKRYRLKQELPTFKKGELFHTDENGNLWRDKGQKGKHWQDEVMAYHHKTIERFPNILTDWFEEYEEQDPLAKEALIKYLKANPEQRLMQAVYNFIEQELNSCVACLLADVQGRTEPEDTWLWECDHMMLGAASSKAEEPEFTTFEVIEKRKKLEQMKNQLKEWAENNDVTKALVFFSAGLVRFRNSKDWDTVIEIENWPRDSLLADKSYDINYLLDTIKTGKE